MGREKIGLILVIFILMMHLTPQTAVMSSDKNDETKTCSSNPSRCGIITNISHPFRLRDDPPKCGLRMFELACENGVTLLQLQLGTPNTTYQVLGINYEDYTIRLRDPGVREGDCSSLPRYFLSNANFTDTFGTTDPKKNPYAFVPFLGHSNLTLDHVMYLRCSDPVRDDDESYVDTATCGVDWESKGGGGGHVYAVVGDLEAGRLKRGCVVESVATIGLDWRSFLKRKNYSYGDIHKVLWHGFEVSWWQHACLDLGCASYEFCSYNYASTQKLKCTDNAGSCFGTTGVSFPLFCGNMAHLNQRVEEFLLGILAGLPSSKVIRDFVESVHKDIETDFADKYAGDLISIPIAFTLGKITAYVSTIIILRFLVGILLLFILLIYTYRRRHLSMYESIEDFIKLHDLHPIRYSYKDLKTMTKCFNDKIGEGGFATIYKGKLRSGYDVAVKMLDKSKATSQEFINEVATMGRIHHFNVARLVGFCVEGKNRALIYDFMSNGSLDKHIFVREGSVLLSYRRLYEISLGVARGIAYLHHGCEMQILHFDIKPQNVLLDDNLDPKISDFGLARLYFTDNSIATLTAARGTVGYMAPELFYKNIGKVSHKSDVYSFGMLLMEIASRRRNFNRHAEHSSQLYFPSWIYDQFDEEKDIEMEDLTKEEKELVKKMLIVALWCIQFNPDDRPSMNKVIEMLEVDDARSLEMPPKPSIYPPDDHYPNCDQATSFSTSSYANLGEDSSDN